MKNKIKIYRTINDVTQEELAKLCNCTRQTIHAIEKGKYLPSLELAFKLSIVLETSIEELFEYENVKKVDN